MTTAVFAGSFNPPTVGHLDIIARASSIWDDLVVAIGTNSAKTPLFTENERIDMLNMAIRQRPLLERRGIRIVSFENELLVNLCSRLGADVLVRGVRSADFDYEVALAQANHTQSSTLHTVFLPTSPEYSFVSSSAAIELARYGGDCHRFVDRAVELRLFAKFGRDSRGIKV